MKFKKFSPPSGIEITWSGVLKSFLEFYGRKYWRIPNMTLFVKLFDRGEREEES